MCPPGPWMPSSARARAWWQVVGVRLDVCMFLLEKSGQSATAVGNSRSNSRPASTPRFQAQAALLLARGLHLQAVLGSSQTDLIQRPAGQSNCLQDAANIT